MDPVSIVGLIVNIGEIASKLYVYGQTVKDGGFERLRLQSELFGLKGALEHISLLVKGNQDGSPVTRYDHSSKLSDVEKGIFISEKETDADTVSVMAPSSINEHQPLRSEVTYQMLKEAKSTLQVLDRRLNESRTTKAGRALARLNWPFKRDEIVSYIEHIEKIKSYFLVAMTTENTQTCAQILGEVKNLKIAVKSEQKLREDTTRKKAISDWLCPCSTQKQQKIAIAPRHEDTGQWLCDGRFEKWLQGIDGNLNKNVLWLRAKSGSGKTVLTASCVEKSRDPMLKSPSRPLATAFFFCSVNDQNSRDPACVLGAFITQLCTAAPESWRIVEDLHAESQPAEGGAPERIGLRDAELLLIKIAQQMSTDFQTLLILDALNESLDSRSLWISLSSIVTTVSTLKLFVSSTEDVHIDSMGTPLSKLVLDISTNQVQEDLVIYMDNLLTRHENLSKLPAALKKEISNELTTRANGSFRWAQCQIDTIIRGKSVKEIRQALRRVPATLSKTYENILTSIPVEDREIVREILIWVTFTRDVLTLEELAEAVVYSALEPTDPQEMGKDMDADARLLQPEDFIKLCSSLLRYDASMRTVMVAHSSVYEYLVSDEIRSSDASCFALDPATCNAHITENCLLYLLLRAFSGGYCGSPDGLFDRELEWPLLVYAALNWTPHLYYFLRDFGEQYFNRSKILALVLKLLATSKKPQRGNLGAWFEVVYPNGVSTNYENTHGLYVAARIGMPEILRAVLATESGRNSLECPGGSRMSTPLHVAAACGYIECVRVLLDAGADPNERNMYGENGLQWAEIHGHRETADLLLQKGADPRLLDPSSVYYEEVLRQPRVKLDKPPLPGQPKIPRNN